MKNILKDLCFREMDDSEEESAPNFKHRNLYMQLEKYFKALDEDATTELGFMFVSQTYQAVLDKRKMVE